MKPQSAKAKGRNACKEVRDMILEYSPSLQPDDILVTSSSVTGEDLRLSPKARELYPFCFEVKNQERLNIWESLAQAGQHCDGTPYSPILVFKRNREPLRCIIDFEMFLALLHVKECNETSPTS